MFDPCDDAALLDLLAALDSGGYDFVTTTPATHARVVARSGHGTTLRDLLGWSRIVPPDALDPALRTTLERAKVVETVEGGWRSRIRVTRLRGRLFVHSPFPTDDPNAVFLGPDSYRFADFIVEELARDSICRNVVDIGTGSGVGVIVASGPASPARFAMTDINPDALACARINAAHAGLHVDALLGEGLADFAGEVDLALANPPYIIDEGERAYRDGGGMLGGQVSLDMAVEIAARLSPGGRLLLYTGSAIVAGIDGFKAALRGAAADAGCTLRYRELDPDVFGEELDRPAYAEANVERIAAVGAVLTRR
ncbi:methyltransferase [Glacieibacterium frigidum]|nr:class I SAM-dependent methyltransferase [Glacieibacterium frigidum]